LGRGCAAAARGRSGVEGMDFPIKGGVGVVTGAASGIGAALAVKLAGRGMHLALADRNAAGLAASAAAARALGVTVSEHVLDVRDTEALEALPAAHGRVSLLVNNAGVALMGSFEQVSMDDFGWVMDINFWAPVRLTRAFMYLLRREEAAHIVNVSSIFGIVGVPGNVPYCASKFAVRGFSEALRHELVGSAISLTVVHPGGIKTAIADSARLSQGIDPAEAKTATAEFNKLLRTAPEEAAAQIVGAVLKRRGRLLIGGDARMIDRIQRIFPMTYWKRVTRGQPSVAASLAPKKEV
jgi:short-subunit dehydrogenase